MLVVYSIAFTAIGLSTRSPACELLLREYPIIYSRLYNFVFCLRFQTEFTMKITKQKALRGKKICIF